MEDGTGWFWAVMAGGFCLAVFSLVQASRLRGPKLVRRIVALAVSGLLGVALITMVDVALWPLGIVAGFAAVTVGPKVWELAVDKFQALKAKKDK